MKRQLLLFVALICVVVANAADGDIFKYNGLNYRIISEENHEVAVWQNEKIAGAIEIPTYVVNGSSRYFVTAIGYKAFYECRGLTSVTIPNTVTLIDGYVFYGCSGLTSVSIPNTVTLIGGYAFWGCSGLTSVTIPNSVTSIGSDAFSGCRGLTSVNIPNSVTEIGGEAFWGCSGLTSVTIPNSVTFIGDYAFWGCSGLTSMTIPNSVTYMGWGPFCYCANLAEIIVEEGNKYFVAIDGVLFNINKTKLIQCPGAKTSVSIPNSVTEICNYAFYDCRRLTSVTIPNSVTEIGIAAFSGSGLTSVTIPNSVTYIGESVFYGCSGLESVVIPEGVNWLHEKLFWGCVKLTKIYNLNPTPQSLENYVFEGVPEDAVVYVPKGSFKQYFVAEGWTRFIDFREMGAFDITMSNEAVELAVGETVTLKAEVNKDDDMTVNGSEWTSSNPAVATVDQDGIVTAVALGEAVIYFTATDGYGVPHAESCKVSVTENSGIESIIADADAPVEVYTVSGIRVGDSTDNLPAGIYIVRRGNVAKKIAVK